MKTLLIIIINLSFTTLIAEDFVILNVKTENSKVYKNPNFKEKYIRILNQDSNIKMDSFDDEIKNINGLNGIWIKITNPTGWIFSSNVYLETSSDISCDFNFKSKRKFSFTNFDIEILNQKLLLFSSFELGNSFNQQIGTWNWENGKIVGNLPFADSTMTDCLNICYENEETRDCDSQCKKESKNKYGKIFVTADIDFEIYSNKSIPTIKFNKIIEYDLKRKSFLVDLGFKEKGKFKAICSKN